MRDLLTLALAAILGAAGGVTGSMLMLNARASEAKPAAQPPVRIAVIRLSDWLPADTTQQAAERAMRAQRAAVDKLVGKGYVVLKAEATFGAPNAILVRPGREKDGVSR